MSMAKSDMALAQPLDANAPPLPGLVSRAFWVGLIVVVLSLISGLATFLILTGLTPIPPSNEVVLGALALNLMLVLAMVVVIAHQAIGLRRAWKDRIAGARLYARVVALFTMIAALPALFLAIGATTTFSRAIDGLFSNRTRSIIANSLEVAQSYVEEHGQVIRTDIVNMAKDLDDEAGILASDPKQFRQQVFAQAGLRDLAIAYIIDDKGRIKVAALEDEKFPFIAPPASMIQAAEAGQVPLLMPGESFRVSALTKLNNYPGSYLYVARGVNPKVVRYLGRTQAGVREYDQLRQRRGGLKFAHGVMFFMTSLTATLAAIWAGLWFAGRLVAPIRRLIAGAQQVARGDLKVQLPVLRGEGDLRRLSMDFNHMTKELERQRTELVNANTQLTQRRRFMEAVLSGVSAGVIGVDADGRITLANPSAEKLLGKAGTALTGQTLAVAVPEFGVLLEEAEAQRPRARAQRQVTLIVDGEERSFSVRVTHETQGEEDYGAVVTFDDVTELVSAQRSSAWADIARRIAHEIKNPLTPIQLSAERIRRKYTSVIKEDREVFDRCTETIIRQVSDVSRMVDEFSSFARMPKPQMEQHDIRNVIRDAVFLFQMGNSDITFDTRLGRDPILLSCDRRLVSQAVTNLIKNAAESIHAVAEGADKEADWHGRIETVVRRTGNHVEIEVIDNGLGLPKQNRTRLLEPYVTTKGSKGTGLGLAIVQKIVEQHKGTLALEDAPTAPGRMRGALIRISLPVLRAVVGELTPPAPSPAI
jgi:two-component system nitrogen regulation sensor histidine kinase NtrY